MQEAAGRPCARLFSLFIKTAIGREVSRHYRNYSAVTSGPTGYRLRPRLLRYSRAFRARFPASRASSLSLFLYGSRTQDLKEFVNPGRAVARGRSAGEIGRPARNTARVTRCVIGRTRVNARVRACRRESEFALRGGTCPGKNRRGLNRRHSGTHSTATAPARASPSTFDAGGDRPAELRDWLSLDHVPNSISRFITEVTSRTETPHSRMYFVRYERTVRTPTVLVFLSKTATF